MMQHKESIKVDDWLKKAEADFARVGLRLKETDIEDDAFHLQQAIEKYLKAFLLSKGWKLKKIHDLEALLDEAVKYSEDLESFRELCEEVTGYYLVERYPFPAKGPSADEVKSVMKRAKEFIKVIQDEL